MTNEYDESELNPTVGPDDDELAAEPDAEDELLPAATQGPRPTMRGNQFATGRSQKRAAKKAQVARKPVVSRGPRQAPPDPESVLEDLGGDLEEDEKALKRFMTALTRASGEKRSAERARMAMMQLMNALGDLSDDTFKTVVANDDFQTILGRVQKVSGDKPGEMQYDEKGREIGYVPWSYDYMCELYEMVSWSPVKSMPIGVNGVNIYVQEGIIYSTPKVFKDIHDDHITSERNIGRVQREALANSPFYSADGHSIETGWRKVTNEELLAAPGNVER